MSNFQFVTFVGGYLDGTTTQVDIENPYFNSIQPIKFDLEVFYDSGDIPDSIPMNYATYYRHELRVKEKSFYIYVIKSMEFSEAIAQILAYYGEKKK